MNLLEIQQLDFSYDKRSPLIANMTETLEAGLVVGLVGPNGSGKTTLIKLIFDLLAKQVGVITINGLPHTSEGARKSAIYLPSDDFLPEFLTGEEYVGLVCQLYGQAPPESLTPQFAAYGTQGRHRHLLEDYSHGMRKKLQMICAAHLALPLTVIDETFNGIDLDAQRQAERDVARLAQAGGAVILSSHDFSMLERVADVVLVMQGGSIVARIDLRNAHEGPGLRENVNRIIFGDDELHHG